MKEDDAWRAYIYQEWKGWISNNMIYFVAILSILWHTQKNIIFLYQRKNSFS